MRPVIASTLLLLAFSHALAAATLSPFEIRFKAETEYLTVGTATLALTRFNDSVFKLHLETEPAGYLKFSGKGVVVETAQDSDFGRLWLQEMIPSKNRPRVQSPKDQESLNGGSRLFW